MGKYPVISITLKSVSAMTCQKARGMLCSVIGSEAMNFLFLKESSRLSDEEKDWYKQLVYLDQTGQTEFIMSDEVLANSLRNLTKLLQNYYKQQVILLIDEYDVPLDKAQQYGYYDEMADMIRGLFGQVLKGNDSLKSAVLTGCLRIAEPSCGKPQESIFTGLNNLRFNEYFGLSDMEVDAMLDYYGMEDRHAAAKKWYDGYRFGIMNVYCPWDVIFSE